MNCPFKYFFSIAKAGLAIWFMLLTKTRYHTGRGLHYQDDFNWSDLKDIPRMHLWSRYFISQIYLLLFFFEVTLMSLAFVWKHAQKEDCFVWHQLNTFMDLWTTKTKKRKTFQFCSKEKMNLSLWALWHRCQILSYSV